MLNNPPKCIELMKLLILTGYDFIFVSHSVPHICLFYLNFFLNFVLTLMHIQDHATVFFLLFFQSFRYHTHTNLNRNIWMVCVWTLKYVFGNLYKMTQYNRARFYIFFNEKIFEKWFGYCFVFDVMKLFSKDDENNRNCYKSTELFRMKIQLSTPNWKENIFQCLIKW